VTTRADKPDPTSTIRRLDAAWDTLASGRDIPGDMQALGRDLEQIRRSLSTAEWRALVRDVIVPHRVLHLVHHDPFSRRAFRKPRGYAGDARVLDYIYFCVDDDDSTELGRAIMAQTTNTPSGRGVRWRKEQLRERIDATARRVPGARILSVAAGHLREADTSSAVRDRTIDCLIALDQDARSLSQVRDRCDARVVQAVEARVRDLILRGVPTSLGQFDFIYAASFYDYLSVDVARRLTRSLFEALTEGGRLLIANHHSSIPCRGYMESLMDWWLIYRDKNELVSCFDVIDRRQIASIETATDPDGAVVIAEVTRAS
jgi:SAM-dependent methyltransferase